MKYSHSHFPDYAIRYKEATGQTLQSLIDSKLDNEGIKFAFFKAGLRKPSTAFLEYFRKLVKDPAVMAERVTAEFKKFLEDKTGVEQASVLTVLDTIISAGFEALKLSKTVTVSETLKAVELKFKMKEGEEPESVAKRIEKEIFSGKQPEEAGPVPEDQI